MLLSGTFEAPCIIKCTRRNGPDGKPEEHLFFDSVPQPKAEPDHKAQGDQPAAASSGT
jgi:hypothetical protein